MRHPHRVCLAILALSTSPSLVLAQSGPQVHAFDVDVDGKAVGTHRFEVRRQARDVIDVRSTADFNYRLLGVRVYRYRHEAEEHWSDRCLTRLSSRTDDNGKRNAVQAELREGALQIESGAASRSEAGCIHAFAYWDVTLLTEPRLLNPQTGAMDSVTLDEVGPAQLPLSGGRTVAARQVRLTGDKLRIDLWYARDGGEWLQLESLTPEGRTLRYRRRADQ